MSMGWTSSFVGIPYEDRGRTRAGSDCYGLVRIVYAERLGTDLPSYDDYMSADEIREVSAMVSSAEISPLWRRVEKPEELDVLVFRTGRYNSHMGLYLSPTLMLHMAEKDCSRVQRYTVAPWSRRLSRTLRWHQR